MKHGFMPCETIQTSQVDRGVRKGLTPGFIESVPETSHRESVKYQIKVMKDE